MKIQVHNYALGGIVAGKNAVQRINSIPAWDG